MATNGASRLLCTILAVTPDPDVRRALIQLLGNEGFEVRTAETAGDALAILRTSGDVPRTIVLHADPVEEATLSTGLLYDMRLAVIPVIRLADEDAAAVEAWLGHPASFAAFVSLLHRLAG